MKLRSIFIESPLHLYIYTFFLPGVSPAMKFSMTNNQMFFILKSRTQRVKSSLLNKVEMSLAAFIYSHIKIIQMLICMGVTFKLLPLAFYFNSSNSYLRPCTFVNVILYMLLWFFQINMKIKGQNICQRNSLLVSR